MGKARIVERIGMKRAVVYTATGNISLIEDVEDLYPEGVLLATTVVGCRALGEALIRLADKIRDCKTGG